MICGRHEAAEEMSEWWRERNVRNEIKAGAKSGAAEDLVISLFSF